MTADQLYHQSLRQAQSELEYLSKYLDTAYSELVHDQALAHSTVKLFDRITPFHPKKKIDAQ